MKLTAKDLMVGDLVMYDDKTLKSLYPTRIECGEQIDYAYKDDCYFGIPITTEFLEKNGFVKHEMYYRTPISEDNLYLEFYQHEGRLRRIYVHKNGREELAFTVEGIFYVHILQHTLRLCGIEREIKL